MAKLYFRYGTVASSKTMNLLAVAHNYKQQGKIAYVFKPALDTRFGSELIRSRTGLEQKADLCLEKNTKIDFSRFKDGHCILVDEAQFLSVQIIEQLRTIATQYDIPVICYGLRTDFKSELFAGSKRLLELADTIEEVKTTCNFCNKKATMNLKFVDGKAFNSGNSIELGCEEKYLPACFGCYASEVGIKNNS